jgi:hypothetical protein
VDKWKEFSASDWLYRVWCVWLWSRRSVILGYDPIKGPNKLWGWWELMHWFGTEIIVDLTFGPFHWHLPRVIIKNYPFLLWFHIKSSIYRNVKSISLCLNSAMDIYSSDAVKHRISGMLSLFQSFLQRNSGTVPRLDQEDLIEKISLSLSLPPSLSLHLSLSVKWQELCSRTPLGKLTFRRRNFLLNFSTPCI